MAFHSSYVLGQWRYSIILLSLLKTSLSTVCTRALTLFCCQRSHLRLTNTGTRATPCLLAARRVARIYVLLHNTYIARREACRVRIYIHIERGLNIYVCVYIYVEREKERERERERGLLRIKTTGTRANPAWLPRGVSRSLLLCCGPEELPCWEALWARSPFLVWFVDQLLINYLIIRIVIVAVIFSFWSF